MATIKETLDELISEALTRVVVDELQVEPSRIFLNFSGLARDMWAHHGRTFAN